ncbi:MAG: hypothetical protein NXI24_12140 [bacterium]|nr:hypothetical protein [bacterium]
MNAHTKRNLRILDAPPADRPAPLSRAMLIALAVSLALIGGCREPKPELPSPTNYPEFVKAGAEAICIRLKHCTTKIIRTLSPGLQNRVTVDGCVETALDNAEAKLAVHTPEMIQFSVLCYQAIVEAPCDQLALMAYWHPACTQLRQISNERFRIYPVAEPPNFD